MRLIAAVVALALAVLPANVGYASASTHAADCRHESAVAVAGLNHHHTPTTVPTDAAPVCCILHCVTFAAATVGPTAPSSGSGRVVQRADERFEGTEVEPAIPPPRA